jgi:hypothetical protein
MVAYSAQLKEFFISSTPWTTTASGRMLDSLHPGTAADLQELSMENFKIVILIMAVLLSLSAVIDKLKLPYPVLLVLVGLIIGFIPILPDLTLDPEIMFLVFLPPLLYDAASRTSWHDFKANIRPISALGISLVFFTATAVAVTAHYFIPNFGWPLAFLLVQSSRLLTRQLRLELSKDLA